MTKLAFAAMAVVMIAGCGDNRPLDQLDYSEGQALIERKAEVCRSNGLAPGTKQMDDCIIVELQSEGARRQGARNAMTTMGAGIQQTSQGYQNAAQRRTNCTTRAPMPGTWSTTYTTSCN